MKKEIQDKINKLEDQCKIWSEYTDFLLEMTRHNSTFLFVHGIQPDPKNIIRAIEFRIRLGIETEWDREYKLANSIENADT